MALRDAGSTGNNCMLLSILAAAGLPPDAAALRARIADAIDSMSEDERSEFEKDVVEPALAVTDSSEVLGATYTADFREWSRRVRTGASMLGAAELHVLRKLLRSDKIDVEVTSLRSLQDARVASSWAKTQRAIHPGGRRKLVLIATDGWHYNWLPQDRSPPSGGCPATGARRAVRHPGSSWITCVTYVTVVPEYVWLALAVVMLGSMVMRRRR